MRHFLFTFVLISLVTLAACGNADDNSPNDTTNEDVDETTNEENTNVSDTSFDNGDYKYEIKEIEQIEGKSDTDVLAIELTYTNNTDEPESPWMSAGIKAEQETEDTVELLDGALGRFPEDYKTELVEMGDSDVKPGKTVDAVIGFEIMFPGEPVILKDFSMDQDGELFERVVETE